MRSLRTTLAASGLRVKLKASVMLRLRGKVRLAIVRGSEWSGEEALRTWRRRMRKYETRPRHRLGPRVQGSRSRKRPKPRESGTASSFGFHPWNLSRLSTTIHPPSTPSLGLALTLCVILTHLVSDRCRLEMVTAISRVLDSYRNSSLSDLIQPKASFSRQTTRQPTNTE